MNAAAVEITITVWHLLALLLAILSTGISLGLWAWRLSSSVKDTMHEMLTATNHTRGDYVRLDDRIDRIEHRVGLLESEFTR